MSEEIQLLDALDGMDPKKRGQLKRATEVTIRIENGNIDITDNLGIPWDRIAFGLTFFDEHGRDLFLRVSKIAEKFNLKEAQEKFDKSLEKKHAQTPGSFFKAAKNAGVDVRPGKALIEGAKGEDDNPEKYLPEGANIDDYRDFGFWEQNDRYYSMSDKGYTREVTNFTMKILYHLRRSRDEAYRIMSIKNDFGFEQLIYMNTDDFVTVGSFRKAITRYGRFLFKGNDTDLLKLQDKLQRDERTTREVFQLGFDKKSALWFFSNGLCDTKKLGEFKSVDEYGIIEHEGDNYFIPVMSKIYADELESYENEKRFLYMKSQVTFEQWSKLFCQVYPKKGMMGIVYWFAAINRDLVHGQVRRFPILNLYGQKGSGKGAMAESLLKLFGLGQHQLMLGGASTVVGFMRKLGQYCNSIVWLDEYKNNLGKNFVESLKNIYDGVGYERGKKDNTLQTHSTPINSAVLLSGQEMPTIEPALYSRVMMVDFEPLELTDEQRALYRQLMSFENDGISFLTVEALRHRDEFNELFSKYQTLEYKWFVAETQGKDITERMIINYSIMAAVCRILKDVMPIPFTYEEFKEYCIELLLNQQFIMSGSDDTSKFWEIMEQLYSRGLIREEKDFELHQGELFLRLQNVYGEYSKELRQRNDPNVLTKPTLENYLQSDKRIYREKKKKKFGDGSYTYCLVFDYKALDINLISGLGHNVEQKYKEMGIKDLEEQEEEKSTESEFLNSVGKTEQLDF